MPIDEELSAAIHEAVVRHLQPHSLQVQLVSFLTELSEQEVSADRKLQRIDALQSQVDLSRIAKSV